LTNERLGGEMENHIRLTGGKSRGKGEKVTNIAKDVFHVPPDARRLEQGRGCRRLQRITDTLAPRAFSQSASHPPLNPVCPVRKTVLPA